MVTCADWCDAAAAKLGDVLDEDSYERLQRLKAMCLFWAELREGRDVTDET